MFARARRAQDFLRFITEETLAGRGSDLSGYTIALKVFGKPRDFDAGNDPLVRVEAGRVRSRLHEYYAAIGGEDAVRIVLRRGSYVPVFRADRPRRAALSFRQRPSIWLAASMPLLLVVVVWAFVGGPTDPLAAGLDGAPATPITDSRNAPRILVQPFRNLGQQESLPLVLGVTEEIMTRLGRYTEITVVVAPSEYFSAAVGAGIDYAATDYALVGSVLADDERVRITPRLIDNRTGRQVWTTAYDESRGVRSVWKIVDDASSAIARSVGEAYGPLFDAEVQRARSVPIRDADSYHCLLRFVFALEAISEASHERATTCFEHAVVAEPASSMSWARLAALYRMEYLHDFNPKHDAEPPLERAVAAAKRSRSLDPDNAFAHQELAFLCVLQGDTPCFEESVARVLALDPSADLKAATGINLVKMGQPERGFALIDRGLAESPRAPPFFFIGYVVHALRTHDYPAAYKWAKRMETPEWPLSQAALAAVAALTQRDDEARAAAHRLLELRPDFADRGRELIERGRLGAESEEALVRGLELAGIELR
jgi:TolB-like protein